MTRRSPRAADVPAPAHLIGLDFGSESARGVLVDADTGELVGRASFAYPHGVMTDSLPDGTPLPRGFALQEASDYVAAAGSILSALGRGRAVAGIGVGFTASSPLPATAEGRPLSALRPSDPHARVKLWKHSAQRQADAINARGGAFLDPVGGRLSGEWLLAKAAEIAEDAPDTWAATERFVEAGDWLVWQLTGRERRSLAFASYKAQYSTERGYPDGVVEGLIPRLAEPLPIGSAAGPLSEAWRTRTGIEGSATVAVAVIDSHVVLPAIGAVASGTLVGALGTSAVWLALSEEAHPLPEGIEGMAKDGSVRGLWCHEAGQAGFGDALDWCVRALRDDPAGGTLAGASGDEGAGRDRDDAFARFEREAAALGPDEHRLLALDWFAGNRVPLADSSLSGLIVGLTPRTTPVEIYRAVLDSLCFGARRIVECYEAGGLAFERVLLASGLARNNALLVRCLADVLGRDVEVPAIDEATAVGAAIHGAVAAGTVADYAEGARRYGAREFVRTSPDPARRVAYDALYRHYLALSTDETLLATVRALRDLDAAPRPPPSPEPTP